jgi:ABC-type polysaccharide/polyol phosphate export permease
MSEPSAVLTDASGGSDAFTRASVANPLPALARRVVVPTKHRVRLSDIWNSWPVARVVGARDMKIKYKQSALGPIWLVVQPAAILAAMVIVFKGVTNVDTGGVPYVLFALAGLSVWIYFQQAISTAAMVMQHNVHVVKRTACPRIALVVGNGLAASPSLAVVVAATFVGTAAALGLPTQVLALPFVLAWMVLFTASISLILATVGARFRDVVALVPLILQVGVFASPVGYPVSSTHGAIAVLLHINPLTGLIEAMRWTLLGLTPSLLTLAISTGTTVVFATLAWWLFARAEVRFADYV